MIYVEYYKKFKTLSENPMPDDILSKKIKLLEILAEGCRTHPAYRARRSATGNCEDCVKVWNARQQLKELEND
jgi:hypothetical protein